MKCEVVELFSRWSSSDDCFPITCTATFACLEQWWLQDTETWLQRLDPKIIDPITIGLSQNQEVMTSQTTRDSPQMTTTFNKTRRKTKKAVESHQDAGPCPPYSAFPQVTTRASPRSTAKAPADAWIWRTSTSCLATLLQSLGEENPEDLVL